MTNETEQDERDSDDIEADDPLEALRAQGKGLSFLERIPLALQVLTVAELAGRVRDVQQLAELPVADLEENEVAGTAHKMRELQTSFEKDLEQMMQKWMRALGPLPQDQAKAKDQMNLIMFAGLGALGVRYHLVQRILRMTVRRERLKAIDKLCQRTAQEFMRGPANGQPGIRRVK